MTKIKRIWIIIPVIAFALMNCMSTKKPGPPVTYEGKLPCDDCSGIMTVLTLKGDMTYILQETYLYNKNEEKTIETKGKWAPLKGFKNDNTAIVYRLLPDNAGDILYFLMADGDTIKKLNKKGEIIKSHHNYLLIRKS